MVDTVPVREVTKCTFVHIIGCDVSLINTLIYMRAQGRDKVIGNVNVRPKTLFIYFQIQLLSIIFTASLMKLSRPIYTM
jgi:hypothetical protein